jgi:hypothetical protein
MTNNIEQFSDSLDKIIATSNPPKPARERELEDALSDLVEHADADCPSEYRSSHFRDALECAREVLNPTEDKA